MSSFILKPFLRSTIALFVCLAFAFLSICQATILSNDDTGNKIPITVGLIVFPPLIHKVNETDCAGRAVETLKKALPPDAFDLSFYCASPARIYRDFAANKIDVTVNVKSTSSLKNNTMYSEKPFTTLEVVLLEPLKRNDKTVSAVDKFDYHGARKNLLSEGFQFLDSISTKDAITVFLRGDAEYLMSYRSPYEYYIQLPTNQRLFKDKTNKYHTESLLKVPSHFVVNRQNPNAKRVIEMLNSYMLSNR